MNRSAEINVTPLIDVVLVMLIIFMIGTPLLERGYNLTLAAPAVGPRPAAAAIAPLLVRLGRDGRIVLEDEEVSLDRLAVAVRGRLLATSARRVLFEGDGDVGYETVIGVLDRIRSAGANLRGAALTAGSAPGLARGQGTMPPTRATRPPAVGLLDEPGQAALPKRSTCPARRSPLDRRTGNPGQRSRRRR